METIIKVLLLVAGSALLLVGVDSVDSISDHDGANNSSPGLVRAYSKNNIEHTFKQSLIEQYGQYDPDQESVFIPASESAGAALSRHRNFSNTTLQESGIDESDRLKTDGKFIYASSISEPEIHVFKVGQTEQTASHRTTVSTLKPGARITGLYLRAEQKQMLAVANDGQYQHEHASHWFNRHFWTGRQTELLNVNLEQPDTPKIEQQLSLDGQLVSSRRIGNMLYVATRQSVSLPDLIEYPENYVQASRNRQLIEKTTMQDLLPKYRLNGAEYELFAADDCFYAGSQPLKHAQHSIISLVAIDLDEGVLQPKGQCFIGDAEAVYASNNAIYLATTQFLTTDDAHGLEYSDDPNTEIHKFTLGKDKQPQYAASGKIQGHLGWQQDLKTFRMSEKDGLLRVLSYVGETIDQFDSPARLNILKENPDTKQLEVVGALPNESRPAPLGKKGELIYASRFIGDRGYLVTFRTTDPLYIIDLSSPSDPYIMSALELDGYSDFLMPIGDRFLLAIGKDSSEEIVGEEFDSNLAALELGVKVSIIDISNPTAPFEKENKVYGKRGSETAVSKTHHALNCIVRADSLEVNIPISVHDTALVSYGSESHPSDYYGWTQDALYRMKISLRDGKVSELPPIVADIGETPVDSAFYFDTNWQHDRSVMVDDKTYYLKRDKLFTAAN